MATRNSRGAARRAERWRELLQRWQDSGLSQAEFCRRRRIAAWKFRWWKRRLSGQGAVTGGSFVPVQLVAAGFSRELELTLPGGRALRFGVEVDVQKLAAIVAALEAIPPEGPPC
jgi:hypothetical protein